MKTLGDRLKEIRKDNGLRQSDLATLFHLTSNQISTYENDQVLPSIEVIKSYCNHFKVSADYLLNINIGQEDSKLEQLVITQILNSSRRLTNKQRAKYLNQLKLYALFLERYKESL